MREDCCSSRSSLGVCVTGVVSSFQARLRSVMRKREAIRPSAWRVTIYPFLYRQHVCANTQVLINQTRWVDDTLVYGCCFGGSQYYHDKSPSRNSPMRLRARLSTDSCHQRELQVSFHSPTARCERELQLANLILFKGNSIFSLACTSQQKPNTEISE